MATPLQTLSWRQGSEIFLRSLTATITIASNRVEFSGPISGMQQNQIPLWEKTTGTVEEQDVFLQRAIISAPLHSAWVPAYGLERIESDLFRSFQGQPHQFRISSPFGSGDYENKIQRSANLPQPTGQILNAGASVQSIDFAIVDDNLIEVGGQDLTNWKQGNLDQYDNESKLIFEDHFIYKKNQFAKQ
ncbi:MAG: hypothetical protein EZS28_023540 [Streblomastix strix]|uniref:Uncharacterized protein n=1 Tax=Streblomastix strix TaxID=222440 RepID=A0A5J4VEW0_9EUKA|nr:MAG: hypothetical protein EZS28_023540 [Streblomastix strix]